MTTVLSSPALMILTSHRRECFDLCLFMLERTTDLSRFCRIYILANALGPEHAARARAFADRHANAVVVECLPRGLVPAVMRAQNEILARHGQDGVVKIDEDVFVTPNWLDHLLTSHAAHAHNDKVVLHGCLAPVSETGRRCLRRFHRFHYPRLVQDRGLDVGRDLAYHEGVWREVLRGEYLDEYARHPHPKYYYSPSLIINCVLYPPRFIELVGAFPTVALGGAPVSDEIAVNFTLRRVDGQAAIPSAALVHHYSHAGCFEALSRTFPVAEVRTVLSRRYGLAG